MSETPIGDEIMGQEQIVEVPAVDPLTEAAQDVVVMEDPYRIPGEDDPADPAAEAEDPDDAVPPADDSPGEDPPADEPTEG